MKEAGMKAKLECWLDNDGSTVPAVLALGLETGKDEEAVALSLTLELPRWQTTYTEDLWRLDIVGFAERLANIAEGPDRRAALIGHDDYDLRLLFRALDGDDGTIHIQGQFLHYLARDDLRADDEQLGAWLVIWAAGSGFRSLLATGSDVVRWARQITEGISRLPEHSGGSGDGVS
jgi:hypothetical protein